MRPRNEGRIKKDFKQMLLHMCRLYEYISGCECGRVAVSYECNISDRFYKSSVMHWITMQLVVSRI